MPGVKSFAFSVSEKLGNTEDSIQHGLEIALLNKGLKRIADQLFETVTDTTGVFTTLFARMGMAEIPTPIPNGTNAVFYVLETPNPVEMCFCFVGGQLRFHGVGYTLFENRITFAADAIPYNLQEIRVWYLHD